jgi:hypothetical protein
MTANVLPVCAASPRDLPAPDSIHAPAECEQNIFNVAADFPGIISPDFREQNRRRALLCIERTTKPLVGAFREKMFSCQAPIGQNMSNPMIEVWHGKCVLVSQWNFYGCGWRVWGFA